MHFTLAANQRTLVVADELLLELKYTFEPSSAEDLQRRLQVTKIQTCEQITSVRPEPM